MPKLVRRRWQADFGAFGGRRDKKGFTYDAYVPDRISEQSFTLTSDVAQALSDAEVALREVNAREPAVSELEVLARQLLRAESVASSRIEGLQLSHRRLARVAFADDRDDITAQSVLANVRAMELAVGAASRSPRFSAATILQIHRKLFSAFDDSAAGRIRTEQNWIGGGASTPRSAEFVPPPPEEVPALLEDLAAFLGRDDLPAVMQAAIAHAQFETIHPFADGNGRVGRCLIHVVLTRREVTPRVVPPISLVLATDAKAYVGGLTDFRAQRLNDWVGLFAAATRTAAAEAQHFAVQLERLRERWTSAAGTPRSGSAARRLIERLSASPIIDVVTVQQLLGCSDQAARVALAQLEKSKVITQVSVGRRNRAWEAGDVFELLNQFERHLATRRRGKTQLRPAPAPRQRK